MDRDSAQKLQDNLQSHDIHIRALSPDNEYTIKKLINNFKQCYGNDYPIKSVYSTEYWKNHIGRRIISLVALEKDEIIAHIGLYPDPKWPEPQKTRHVQALYLSYDPTLASPEKLSQIAILFREQIKTLMENQKWDMVYSYAPRVNDKSDILEKCFTNKLGLSKTAILPKYFHGNSDSPSFDCSVDIMLSENIQKSLKEIFPYDLFAEDIAKKSKQMNLLRTFKHSDKAKGLDGAYSDVNGSYTRTFEKMNITYSFISPSLLDNTNETVNTIDAYSRKTSQVVYVNLEDMESASCVKLFLERGFNYCGYFPLLNGHDRTVLSKNRNEETLINQVQIIQGHQVESSAGLNQEIEELSLLQENDITDAI